MDLEISGGVGNLSFDKNRTTALSDEEGAFSARYYPLILVRLSAEFNRLSFDSGYERDPLMRNRLFANLKFENDYFLLEAGPFIGLFNTGKFSLNPGISGGFGLMVPGILFFKAAGSSTLGAPMEINDNYYMNYGSLSAGFWVPHVICSLNINVKNFSVREQPYVLIEDRLLRYYFRADVYTKNMPYTIRVDLGYQNLSRSYTTDKISDDTILNATTTDEFKSVFLGLEVSYTVNPFIKVFLAGEMPVYSWGVRPMKDPPKERILFQARTGVVLTLSGRQQTQ